MHDLCQINNAIGRFIHWKNRSKLGRFYSMGNFSPEDRGKIWVESVRNDFI